MSAPSSDPNAEEAILAAFVADLEKRGRAAIDEHVRRHPALADEFRALASMNRMLDQSKPEAAAATHPERLGEFRIVRPIGRGGMGEIYEAVQEPLDRRVAVKTIRQGRISPTARERFLREQKVLANLHQTHIVPIHTAGEEGNLQYFAMPYIEGAALHHVVRTALQLETAEPHSKTPSLAKLAEMVAESKDAPMGPAEPGPQADAPADEEAVRPSRPTVSAATLSLSMAYFRSVAEVMVDAAEAVQHAHAAHILHRDLKPSNLMVDTTGHCWIIDFGLASYVRGRSAAGATQPLAELGLDPVTVSGVLGTPHYMAPEQFQGKADVRTDVWGLGATLYELLTLRPAVEGVSLAAIQAKVLSDAPTPPQELVSNLPADLAAICLKALRKEAGQRYQTAGEFADDLGRWLRGEPTRARPAWVLRRVSLWVRRNKGWAAAIFSILLAFLMVIGLEIRSEKTHRAEAEAGERRQRREAAMQQLLTTLLTPRQSGWASKSWELVVQAASVQTDPKLRDLAAATLDGLDAHCEQFFPHLGASSAAFAPDSRHLLVGGARLLPTSWILANPDWRAALGPQVRLTAEGLRVSERVGPVAWQADGTPVQLVRGDGPFLQLLDLAHQKPLRVLRFPEGGNRTPAYSLRDDDQTPSILALSSDGTYAAAVLSAPDKKRAVLVWQTASGQSLPPLAADALELAFAPDASLLAVALPKGVVRIWSIPDGREQGQLPAERWEVYALALSPDNRCLAVGYDGGAVKLWNWRQRQHLLLPGSDWEASALVFSPDGTLLVSAGRNAQFWDAATGRFLLRMECGQRVNGLVFSPDGQKLAITFLNSDVAVWALEYGRGLRTLRGLASRITKVWFSPDDRQLAALTQSWEIAVWDLPTGHLRRVLERPAGVSADNAALAFGPKGRLAFAAGTQACLWDRDTKLPSQTWELPEGLVDQLAFHATDTTERLLLFRAEDRARRPLPLRRGVRLDWVIRGRDLLRPDWDDPLFAIPDFPVRVLSVAALPDGSRFVVAGLWDGPADTARRIRCFDGLTGALVWELPAQPHSHTTSLTLDPGGRFLSVHPFRDRQALAPSTLVATATGEARAPLPYVPIALSPQEWHTVRSVTAGVSPSNEGLVVWQDKDPEPLVVLSIASRSSGSPAFDHRGQHLAWGNVDGTVTVCDLEAVQNRLSEVGLGW